MAKAYHSIRSKEYKKTGASKQDMIDSGTVQRNTETGMTREPNVKANRTGGTYRGEQVSAPQTVSASKGNYSPTVANAMNTLQSGALGTYINRQGAGQTSLAKQYGGKNAVLGAGAVQPQTDARPALMNAALGSVSKAQGTQNPLASLGGAYAGAMPAAANGMSTTDLNTYNLIQQMQQNSAAWKNATPEERERLAAENERLGSQIGAWRDDSGVWHYGTGNLYDMQYQEPVVQTEPFQYAGVMDSPLLNSQYQAVLDAANKVTSRADFSYNPATDPLYQQYADSYTRSGQRAMTDVLGQLAARTGGMASSYAGSMAQQTYDNYMADLANKIPELYQTAYKMYADDLDRDRQDFNMLYGMYTDALGQYNTDRNFAYNQYRDTVGDARWNLQNRYSADRDLISDRNAERNWQHQLEREGVEDQRYEQERAEANRQTAVNQLMELAAAGGEPTQAMLDMAGMSLAAFNAMKQWAQTQFYTLHHG